MVINMKKIGKFLPLFLVLALFLSGCTGENNDSNTGPSYSSFKGGDEGIVTSVATLDSTLYNGNEILVEKYGDEVDTGSIVLDVENFGESTAENVRVDFNGFDTEVFVFDSNSKELVDPIEADSEDFAYNQVEFELQSIPLEIRGSLQENLAYYVTYNYNSISNLKYCLENPLLPNKKCEPAAENVIESTSGAPLKVAKVSQDIRRTSDEDQFKAVYTIYFENPGNGRASSALKVSPSSEIGFDDTRNQYDSFKITFEETLECDGFRGAKIDTEAASTVHVVSIPHTMFDSSFIRCETTIAKTALRGYEAYSSIKLDYSYKQEGFVPITVNNYDIS